MLKREIYLSRIRGFYDSDLIKILVGIRRCGKSVILKQIIEEIKEKGIEEDHILYINFEFVEFEDLKDYKKLNGYIKEKIKDNKKYYIFLDEIQNVEKFEIIVNSLRASLENISIFITGSNSKLLSNELSTVLSGRYVLFNIYPLTYKEYIELTGKNSKEEESFWDFVKWGGLPNRVQFTDEINIKDYLHSVFDSIILRDVVERLGLKDTILFNLILEGSIKYKTSLQAPSLFESFKSIRIIETSLCFTISVIKFSSFTEIILEVLKYKKSWFTSPNLETEKLFSALVTPLIFLYSPLKASW